MYSQRLYDLSIITAQQALSVNSDRLYRPVLSFKGTSVVKSTPSFLLNETRHMAYIPKNYARLESGYREKALKLFPWVCGRCSREFVYSNLRELTVHHIDHDHSNNPEDGSNWEMLCLYCHDHEHSKYTDADMYGSTVVAGEDAQKDVGVATHNPFANLQAMMNKGKK